MITVKEIAKMCDVSPSTVSNILNGKTNMTEETRQRVMKVVEETGYRPNFFAQGMRRQNNKCICIIAEELLQFSTPPIVEAIMVECEARGYRTILINMSMYEKWKKTGVSLGEENLLNEYTSPALHEAKAMRADGVIYVAAHGHVLSAIPDDFGIPIVFAYGPSRDNKYKSVLIDDCGGSELIIDYLFTQGHKRIGVIAGKADNLHTISRMEGYRKSLLKHSVEFDKSIVLYGDWERDNGKECASRLLSMGVTTIWCMNDLMAAGAYDAIKEAGLEVGRDISVFGFDNREIAEFLSPGLSTCELPLEGIGVRCAELIIKEIEDEGFKDEISAPIMEPCELVIRKSIR